MNNAHFQLDDGQAEHDSDSYTPLERLFAILAYWLLPGMMIAILLMLFA